MNSRSRQLVILIAILVVIFTIYNLRGNFAALSRLPSNQLHHIDAARREAQTVPFTEREHRLERQPRLEFGEGGVSRPVRVLGEVQEWNRFINARPSLRQQEGSHKTHSSRGDHSRGPPHLKAPPRRSTMWWCLWMVASTQVHAHTISLQAILQRVHYAL